MHDPYGHQPERPPEYTPDNNPFGPGYHTANREFLPTWLWWVLIPLALAIAGVVSLVVIGILTTQGLNLPD